MAEKMRGLESLIPQRKVPRDENTNQDNSGDDFKKNLNTPIIKQKNTVLLASVDSIRPNPLQPRTEFNDDRLDSLTESVRVYGVLQPLLVNRVTSVDDNPQTYELIAGERRLRAAKRASLREVPVIVRDMPESTQKLEVALIENIQRDNLNPVEEGRAFKQLHDELGVSYDNISKRISKSQPHIVNTVRILNLPDDMQRAVMVNDITAGHTRPLLSLNHNSNKQQELFDSILRKQMTVRDTERMAQDMLDDNNIPKTRVVNPRKVDVDTLELLDVFKNVKGIIGIEARSRNGRSRVSISFRSKDDLHRWLKDIQSLSNNH